MIGAMRSEEVDSDPKQEADSTKRHEPKVATAESEKAKPSQSKPHSLRALQALVKPSKGISRMRSCRGISVDLPTLAGQSMLCKF